MTRLAAWIRRAPLAAFFAIAFLFTWSLLPLAAASIPVSLLALCGPAAAAFAVTAACGREEWRPFLGRMFAWRIAPAWYAFALLLPLPVTALRSGLEHVLGARGTFEFVPVTILGLVVFLLVVGEEAGWRGFALPRLQARFGPWRASAILGAAWALWHLPLFFMPGMPQFGAPFAAFPLYTTALSVILTFLARGTRGSVVVATLFHGSVNTFGVVNTAAGPDLRGWSNALAYGLAALAVGSLAWRSRRERRGTRDAGGEARRG